MLPREHGSWAVLIAPILTGLAAAGGGPWSAAALFCLGALGGFLARVPLQSMLGPSRAPGARAWLALYAAAAAAGFLPLLLHYGRWGLLAFAVPATALLALNLYFNLNRRTFTLANELAGVAGLSLGAPAAYYALRGGLDPEAWWLWGLNAAYFIGPIFHVKTAALRHRAASDPRQEAALARMRAASIAYHSAATASVACAAALGPVPGLAALPFLAAWAKAWRQASKPPSRVDFLRLGYQEVAFSALFALVLAGAYFL